MTPAARTSISASEACCAKACSIVRRVAGAIRGEVGRLTNGRIWLAVNDVVKQDADLAELIWPVSDIISIVSRSMALKAGDIIMTGTPAGVGPVELGDRITGGIDGLGL